LSYRRIQSQARFQQELRHALSAFTKDIKNMMPVSNIPFKGDHEGMGFVAMLSSKDNADINTGYVRYQVQDNGYTKSLARNIMPISHALSGLEGQGHDSEGAVPGNEKTTQYILLDNIVSASFSYFSAKRQELISPADIGQGEIAYEWTDLWESSHAMPIGIKIELSVQNPTNNETAEFSKRIWIPVGKPVEVLLD
jgi:hypothetical protein